MKVINTSGNTIYADDIDMYFPYVNGQTENIDPDLLKKSRCLRGFILNGMLEVIEHDENERVENSLMYMLSKRSKYINKEKNPGIEEDYIEDICTPSDLIEVKMHGIFLDAGGYAKVNRNVALKLHEAGLKIKIDPKRSQNQLNEEELKPILRLQKTPISRNHILIDSIIPSFAELSSGKYKILYTTIESYTIPKQFIDCCKIYNEVWVTCLEPSVVIETTSGPKSLDTVNIGDYVFSVTGESKKVIDKRKIRYKGKVIELKTRNGHSIRMTPWHRLYVRKTIKFDQELSKRNGYTVFTHKEDLSQNSCQVVKYLACPPEYCAADNIKENDWVYSPNRINQVTNNKILITDFVSSTWFVSDKNIILSKNTYTRKNTKKHWIIPRSTRIKNVLYIDDEIAYMLGLYVAKGSNDSNSFCFTMHEDEIDILQKLSNIIQNHFGLPSTIRKPNFTVKGLEMRTCSRLLCDFLTTTCDRGASNKKVPHFIFMMSRDIKISFLKGVLEGDGWIYKNSISLSTMSKKLRDGCVSLLYDLNLLPSIGENSKSQFNKKRNIQSGYTTFTLSVDRKQFVESELLAIKGSCQHGSKSFNSYLKDDSGFWHKVKSTELQNYDDEVIDITVEDETFCVQSICSHNSKWSADILRKEIKKPVYSIVTGVDHKHYCDTGPKFDLKPNVKDFVFLSVFGWNYRKGYDVLLRAYFDEFSADDNVTLLLVTRYQSGQSRYHRNKVRDDIAEIMKEFPNKNLPHVVRYSKVTPEKDMPKLYRACDCFILTSRGEGGCTLAGTKIVTNNGLKNIEEIKQKDYVLTHKNRFRKVISTKSRFISEPVYHIKTSLNLSIITLTGEHPSLCLKRKNTLKHNKKDKCKFTLKNSEWLTPKNLEVGDYLVIPNNYVRSNVTTIDLTHYFDCNDYIVNLETKSIRKKSGKTIPSEIECSSLFLNLVGFYISEGCSKSRGSQLTFSFHSNELCYHKIIRDSMSKYFNENLKELKNYDDRKYRFCLSCHNTVLNNLFANMCGRGSHNKHLPDFAWNLSKPQILDLLYGVFCGDGSFDPGFASHGSPSLTLSTVSERLANETVTILRSIGFSPCLLRKKHRGFVVLIKGQQLNNIPFKGAKWNGIVKDKSICTDEYIFTPIKEIRSEWCEDTVYNLEVEQDESYTTNCFTVHNCLPPLEASLCGLPIIMTNCSGQQGYLRNDNAFPIEIDHIATIPPGSFKIHYWDGQKFPVLKSDKVHNDVRLSMRYVVNNYAKAKKRNQKMQKLILKNFTWNNTANQAIARLEHIHELLKG